MNIVPDPRSAGHTTTKNMIQEKERTSSGAPPRAPGREILRQNCRAILHRMKPPPEEDATSTRRAERFSKGRRAERSADNHTPLRAASKIHREIARRVIHPWEASSTERAPLRERRQGCQRELYCRGYVPNIGPTEQVGEIT